MVQFAEHNKIYIKILYWGMFASGKTTILETLYRLTKEQNKDVIPIGQLEKIEMDSGATLYFDRCNFQSKTESHIFYNVWTVAGQKSFLPLRKKAFQGTDGVIFVVDSSASQFQENVGYL